MTIGKWAAFKRIFGYTKGFRAIYACSVGVYSSQAFANGLINSLQTGMLTAAILSGIGRDVILAMAAFVAILLAYSGLIGWGVHRFTLSAIKADRALKTDLFRSFVRTSVEAPVGAGAGIAAINTEAAMALNVLTNSFSALLSSLTALVLSAILIFAMDWRLGLISLAVGLLALVIQSRFAPAFQALTARQLDANVVMTKEISNHLTYGLPIRAFSLQDTMAESFDLENKRMVDLANRRARLTTLQSVFTNLQGFASVAGVLGIGAYFVATGSLSFPVLMMVPPLCMSLGQGLSTIGASWAGMQAPLEAARRVCRMVDRSREMEQADSVRQPVAWDGDSRLGIQEVTFAYEGGPAVLDGISLEIEPGRLVAFVGESGCGKSTLLRHLTGMYERGRQPVRLGNLTLGVVPVRQWRRQFALVDQSCKLFDMTITENIALGRAEDPPGREEIQEAARLAGAYEFIGELPDGFDTNCGEQGASLSGGQRQRIAIARALVRKAPVLVLDEATAALDNQSERAIMETVQALRGRYTILMVTHNLEQVNGADEIVVLKEGKIAERGTHPALLERRGEYARLWERRDSAEVQ